MWNKIGSEGEVERGHCWDLILADLELANLIGRNNQAKGKAMLESMKAVRALDKDGTGTINLEKFQRLYLPSNLLAAEWAVQCGLDPSYLQNL